jgi:hypothetical protein
VYKKFRTHTLESRVKRKVPSVDLEAVFSITKVSLSPLRKKEQSRFIAS